jgi:tetratricopeptide (TPR) repeat protein
MFNSYRAGAAMSYSPFPAGLRTGLTWRLPLLAFLVLTLTAPALASADCARLAGIDRLLASSGLDLAQAQKPLSACEDMLTAAQTPRAPLLLRLARVCFLLGDQVPQGERRVYYQKGLAYAEQLLREQPLGAAGRYWTALNLCGLADTGGKLQGRRLLPRILGNLQRVVALEETYDQAGAHRILGRIYYEAPRPPFSVGDLQKSLKHLIAAVRLAPQNSTNHLYLAETLLRLQQPAQARQELERVLTATQHAIQPQGLEDDRREAHRLLAEMEGK